MLGVVLRLTSSKDMAIAIEGGAGIGLRHSAMLRAMQCDARRGEAMRKSVHSLRFTPRAVSSTLEPPTSSRDRAIAEEEGSNIAPWLRWKAGVRRERGAYAQ